MKSNNLNRPATDGNLLLLIIIHLVPQGQLPLIIPAFLELKDQVVCVWGLGLFGTLFALGSISFLFRIIISHFQRGKIRHDRAILCYFLTWPYYLAFQLD